MHFCQQWQGHETIVVCSDTWSQLGKGGKLHMVCCCCFFSTGFSYGLWSHRLEENILTMADLVLESYLFSGIKKQNLWQEGVRGNVPPSHLFIVIYVIQPAFIFKNLGSLQNIIPLSGCNVFRSWTCGRAFRFKAWHTCSVVLPL